MSAAPILVTGAAGFAGSHLARAPGRAAATSSAGRAPIPPPDSRGSRAGSRSTCSIATRVRARDRASCGRRRSTTAPALPHVGAVVGATRREPLAEQRARHAPPARRAAPRRRRLPRARHRLGARSTRRRRRRSPRTTPLAPASPYALSKLAQEQLGAARAAPRTASTSIVTRSFNHTGPRQSAGVRRAEHRAADRADRARRSRAGDPRRQPRRAARPHRRARHRARLRAADGARRRRATSTTSLRRRRTPIRVVLDALARTRPRRRPRRDRSRRGCGRTTSPVLVGDSARLRAATGWAPPIPFDQMLDDLLDYWRAEVQPQLTHSVSVGSVVDSVANIRRMSVDRHGICATSLRSRQAQADHPPDRRPGQSRRRRGAHRRDPPRRRGAVPGGAVPLGAEPREGDAVRVDAQPVPRLHARLPLLLRPPLPDAVRARRRTTSSRRSSSSRRTSSRCCGASCSKPSWTRRVRRRRHRHRLLSADRRPLQADAPLARGAAASSATRSASSPRDR